GAADARARRCGAAGGRRPERDPLDQVCAQQLAARDRADLRRLARHGIPRLLRSRAAGRRRGAAREAPSAISVRRRRLKPLETMMQIETIKSGAPRPLANYNECFKSASGGPPPAKSPPTTRPPCHRRRAAI